MKICFCASEIAPFAKTGGLADVAAALPRRLRRLGHDVRVFAPFHAVIDRRGLELHTVDFASDVAVDLGGRTSRFALVTTRATSQDPPVYFIDCPELFHRPTVYTGQPDEARRFTLFSRAIVESCQRMGWAPDVFHCNDWHVALLPLLLRTVYEWDGLFGGSKTLLTLHNIGYQGLFGAGVLDELGLRGWASRFDQDDLRAGRVNFLRTGLIYADAITTVSPTYAREILGPELGMGLEDVLRARSGRLVGILNGVDYDEWSPETDRFIPCRYSAEDLDGKRENKRALLQKLGLDDDPRPPLVGVVSRLVAQKGFDLCVPVLPELLARTPVRMAILGSGEATYEQFFERLRARFPAQVGLYRGYDEELAHWIEAGADLFLMPSRYEPCGLNQMFSLRYGTVPVVRRTGGLADSVEPFDTATGEGTGIVFDTFDPQGLRWALDRALRLYAEPATWRRLVRNGMARDFSWDRQAGRYVELYDWMVREA